MKNSTVTPNQLKLIRSAKRQKLSMTLSEQVWDCHNGKDCHQWRIEIILPVGCGVGTLNMTFPKSRRKWNEFIRHYGNNVLLFRDYLKGKYLVEVPNTSEMIDLVRSYGGGIKRSDQPTTTILYIQVYVKNGK